MLRMGTVAFALGVGHPSEKLVLQVAAWTPIALTIAIMLALFYLGYMLFGEEWPALIAPALFALALGPLLPYSLLSDPDHHAAKVLLILVTVTGSCAAAAGATSHSRAERGAGTRDGRDP